MSKTVMNTVDVVISVIIPLYNGADRIGKCLDCLDKQTIRKDFEVLIVDDASPDNSAEKVEKSIMQLRNADRFRVVRCNKNGRAGRARNIGVQEAAGSYIVFIDQDDYPDNTMLEKLYELTEDGKYDCSACDVVDKNGKKYHRHPCSHIEALTPDIRKDIMGKFGYVFAVLIRKDVLVKNNIVFPENVMFEDVLYNFGWLTCIKSINTTEETLYFRDDDDNSQTAFFTTKKLRDRVRATELYLEHFAEHSIGKEYSDIINQFAFYYIFISCIWWMMMSDDLYDTDFFNYCWSKGHLLNINWKEVLKTQEYFGKIKLIILEVVYYMPALARPLRFAAKIRNMVKQKGNTT